MAKESKGKKALKTTGRALKSAASSVLGAGSQILGAGSKALANPRGKHLPKATAKEQRQYEHILKSEMKRGRSKKTAKRIAAATVRKGQARKRNKTIIKAKRIDHLDVSKVHNPKKRIKVRNRYIDIIIKGQAKKTPQGWKVGRKTFAQGRGTVSVSSGYYLDKATGFVYAKRARNATKKRRNVEGFYDPSGVFHPIRAATDYDRTIAGETGKKPRRTRSKKRLSAKRKASATARHRSLVKARKATTTRLATRSLKKSVPLKKKRGRKNPSAESIRKKFAGSITGSRDLYFPQGTPSGKLAKLGKLQLIEAEHGKFVPVKGIAWLCSDTNGKLHIGTPNKGYELFTGAARNYGRVKRIEYQEAKPHLGDKYRNQIIWFHHMGEGGGQRPTFRTDGKGGARFIGGTYQIRREGIVG